MRILIFSDTHGRINSCIEVIRTIPADMVIHAGDCMADAEDLQAIFPELPIHFVRGNNDFCGAKDDIEIEAEGKRIFVTHGHRYRVKTTLEPLKDKGVQGNYDLIVFGHTHRAWEEYNGKTILFNPGTMGYPLRTYGVAEIDETGKLRTSIIEYDRR